MSLQEAVPDMCWMRLDSLLVMHQVFLKDLPSQRLQSVLKVKEAQARQLAGVFSSFYAAPDMQEEDNHIARCT